MLIDDSTERSMLGQGGRNFIIENDLTWNNAAARYCNIYEEILPVRQVQF